MRNHNRAIVLELSVIAKHNGTIRIEFRPQDDYGLAYEVTPQADDHSGIKVRVFERPPLGDNDSKRFVCVAEPITTMPHAPIPAVLLPVLTDQLTEMIDTWIQQQHT